MLTISFLFLSRAHDRNKGKLKKSTKDLKGAEKLHKHADAAIIPTDAFKLQILLKKGPLPFVVNIQLKEERFKSFF